MAMYHYGKLNLTCIGNHTEVICTSEFFKKLKFRVEPLG